MDVHDSRGFVARVPNRMRHPRRHGRFVAGQVKPQGEHQILAVLSGRIRMNFVRIVPGDKVRVVLSPYDLTRGRIIWRVR